MSEIALLLCPRTVSRGSWVSVPGYCKEGSRRLPFPSLLFLSTGEAGHWAFPLAIPGATQHEALWPLLGLCLSGVEMLEGEELF